MRTAAEIGTARAVAKSAIRYHISLAGPVADELRRWRREAQAIRDPELRMLALEKLRDESANARAAALLAAFTPAAQRREIARGIVALEVLFDYLDGRTEQPVSAEPLEQRRALFAPLHAALWAPVAPLGIEADRSYTAALAATARCTLDRLAGAERVRARIKAAALRAAEAQARIHAANGTGLSSLYGWASTRAADTQLGWREYLAGSAASVLAVHALLATAAAPTRREPQEIDTIYLCIGALAALLDAAVDHERDQAAGSESLATLYRDGEELAEALLEVADTTIALIGSAHTAVRERVMLAGLIAYYLTGADADSAYAKPVLARLRREHRRLLAPALPVVWMWRRT